MMDAIRIKDGTVREYVVMRFPGGTAVVGRNADLFVTPVPEEALAEASKLWYMDIQSFDSRAQARAWADEHAAAGEVYDVPDRKR